MTWTTPRTWTDGELITAAIFNTHVRDNIGYLRDGGDSWHDVAGGIGFQNSWVDYSGSPWGPTRYRRVGPFTVIQGLVKNGTITGRAFELPAGYRPSKNLIFSSKDAGAATAYCELRIGGVGSHGDVVPWVGSNAFFSLACVYLAEE